MVKQKELCGVSAYTGRNAADLPRSAWERLIDEWIFSERDRDILKRRLLDGVTFAALAIEFDMSEKQIRRITAKGLDKLLEHLV